jgi:hypothetical protein
LNHDGARAGARCLFGDPNLGRDALYRAGAAGPDVSVRAVARLADRVGSFGETRIASDTALFDLRVAEVPEPKAGDSLEVAGLRYLIQGEPLRDAERLIWTVEARPT